MITVGLDFGTHQTKVCVEDRVGNELSYQFMTFANTEGNRQYAFPSIIGIGNDGRLTYGFLPKGYHGRIVRYFKQACFHTLLNEEMSHIQGMQFAVLYIAFILFDLEEKYGQDFHIQMGAPTDFAHLDSAQQTAVSILSAAYRLVEDAFENDKNAFLNTGFESLVKLIQFPQSSEYQNIREEYQILVFPEAYACLMPLIKSSRIAKGMSLMVDIGGGTTDISFFTIKNNKPTVYDFVSINKGLNFLTEESAARMHSLDSNIKSVDEILHMKRQQLNNDIETYMRRLLGKLRSEFRQQTKLNISRLTAALNNRPIIYSGGGSTFKILRSSHGGFKDVIHISAKEWKTESVKDLQTIIAKNLCPILSTAYGLSIGVADDNIKQESFSDVFINLRGAEEDENKRRREKHIDRYVYGRSIDRNGFDYGTDYDALK